MFRDEDDYFKIPLEALIHPITSLSYCSSKKEFLNKRGKEYLLNLPHSLCRIPLSMAWCDDGLFMIMDMPFQGPYSPKWPKYSSGDAVEFFIDTRNMRSFRLLHRFCHHFILFPEALEGVVSKEITQFRTQETRLLAADNSVKVELVQSKGANSLYAFFPAESLYGWDTEEMHSLGIGYCIYSSNRSVDRISFPLDATKVRLEHYPYRWATAKLIQSDIEKK